MLKISQLFIYPIKSLRGISVLSSMVTDRGLQYDRRWMLVDANNKFISLREFPKMALLSVSLETNELVVESLEQKGSSLKLPYITALEELESVAIWNATVHGKRVGDEADAWFSDMIGAKCKLVFMPDSSLRPVDTTSGYAPKGKFTSFADAYPFMMIGEASLNDLNSRMQIPVSMRRFRPNIVFSGGYPYQEDSIEYFTINNINFTGLENCGRCMIPNVDPDVGAFNVDREPIKTLSKYRMTKNRIEFGRNVVHNGTGVISVGDELNLL